MTAVEFLAEMYNYITRMRNVCGYDQWRITSTKLSKYDTE